MKPIPYGRQNITEDDINEVVNVLKSDFLTQGPIISEFETSFAKYVNSKFAIAVSNGTAALHLSAMALGIQTNDKIITTPITFAASANCIRYCGGEVVFADINPSNYCLDISKVRELLEKSPLGTYKGIIPVDFAGYPINLHEYRKLADEYNLWIIEDACHSPGGYFTENNSKQLCGNGIYADLSIFSFHPVKHIACGEGGMITTNNEELYKKLIMLRTHGITRDANLLIENHGGWYYEMHELGYNYRLTDFQAALGNSQLKQANKGLEKRRDIAKIYYEAFQSKPYIKSQSGVVDGHAYHLYIIEVENRLELYNYLRSNNIFAQVHYIPLHIMPYYKKLGWRKGDLPIAEKYYARCISLPMYPTLLKEEQEYVIKKIINFYE